MEINLVGKDPLSFMFLLEFSICLVCIYTQYDALRDIRLVNLTYVGIVIKYGMGLWY